MENNIAYMRLISVEINEIRNDIVINEIMYAPNKPEPEWIEIINRSDKAINLKNFKNLFDDIGYSFWRHLVLQKRHLQKGQQDTLVSASGGILPQ